VRAAQSADRHAQYKYSSELCGGETKCAAAADEEILIGRCIIAFELFFPLAREQMKKTS
jgi:hypothetical protein